jgi:formylglycine-generating enzyme
MSVTRVYIRLVKTAGRRATGVLVVLIVSTTIGTLSAVATDQPPGGLKTPFDGQTAKRAQTKWARWLKHEVLETDSIGIKLALVPPGEFDMGSPNTEVGMNAVRQEDEKQHKVKITKPFFFCVCPVTQTQFRRVMGSNPSTFSAGHDGTEAVRGLDTSQFPVESLSWQSAREFCTKLSKLERKTYRLPTEAESEYVIRAGTTTIFFVGNLLTNKQANFIVGHHRDPNDPYCGGQYGDSPDRTVITGSLGPPNAFGLYDMAGNVRHWCRDWYDKDYYANSPTDDPGGPTTGAFRVARGGCWNTGAYGCRSACRYPADPAVGDDGIGLRVVREL